MNRDFNAAAQRLGLPIVAQPRDRPAHARLPRDHARAARLRRLHRHHGQRRRAPVPERRPRPPACSRQTASRSRASRAALPRSIARRTLVSVATLAPEAYPGAAIIGRSDPYKIYGYEAMKLILDAHQRRRADQGGVLDALRGVQNRTACSGPTASTPTATRRCAPTGSTPSAAARCSWAGADHRRREQQEAVELELAAHSPSGGAAARRRRAAGPRRTRRRRAGTRRCPGRRRPARRTPETRRRQRALDDLQLRRRVGQRRAARLPVDRAAVVGVDQRQAQQLVALVDVGDARHGQLEQELAERGAVAGLRDLALERLERAQEVAVGEQRAREPLDRGLVRLVRLDPGRVHLGLAQRLLEVGLEPLDGDRPHAEQRLEDEQLLDGVGRAAGRSATGTPTATSARGTRTRPPSRPARRSAPARRRSASCRASA